MFQIVLGSGVLTLPQTTTSGATFRYFYGTQRTSTTLQLVWSNIVTNTTALGVWSTLFNVYVRLASEQFQSNSSAIVDSVIPASSMDLDKLEFDLIIDKLIPATEYQIQIESVYCTGQREFSQWIDLTTSAQPVFGQPVTTPAPPGTPIFIDIGYRLSGPNNLFYIQSLQYKNDTITDIFRTALAPYNDDITVMCFGTNASVGSTIRLRVSVSSTIANTVGTTMDEFPISTLLLNYATNVFAQRAMLGNGTIELVIESARNVILTAIVWECPSGTLMAAPVSTTTVTTTSTTSSATVLSSRAQPSSQNDADSFLKSTSFLIIGVVGGFTLIVFIACIMWHCCRTKEKIGHLGAEPLTLTNNFSMKNVQMALSEAAVF